MSVTVEDALKLPSLRNAKIVAGKNGLGKIVSGISVLESADPKTLISDLFQNGDYLASELVITSFYNCIDNVDLQCQIIRRLAEGGEVGLILFYVGVYLPSIARECLDIANELDFPLIQMPENISLRYGEVISDVSECLYHDRTQQVSMASDILARVTVLPEHQRTVNVVLKMLSVHLQASVVLTNADYSILNLAAWPSGMEDTIGKHKDIFRKMGGKTSARYPYVPEGYVYHMSVAPAFSSAMELFLIKEGEPLNYKQQEQAADLVRIGVNIWGKQHSSIVLSELIRAILQDDPIKMRRLADIFRIHIRDIDNMWIISGSGESALSILQEKENDILEVLQSSAENVFCDFYDDRLFAFSSTPYSVRELEEQLISLVGDLRVKDPAIVLYASGCLQTTTDVRKAYLCYKDHLKDARIIYPQKYWLTQGELKFSENCHKLIDQGEDIVRQMLKKINILQEKNLDWDVEQTLGAYLLDTGCSITASARQLHVHQNTIKYRLSVVANTLGVHPSKMPDNFALYQGIAVRRLLKP